MQQRAYLAASLSALGLFVAALAHAQTRVSSPIPDGAELVRLLGSRAPHTFASPQSHGIGALVRLPRGVRGEPLGLRELAPGIARLWDTPAGVVSFARAHPNFPIEVAPPLRLLLDTATAFVRVPSATGLAGETLASDGGPGPVLDGTGAVVGIADTGVDLTHPDFLDASGRTRVAWLLDLGAPPRGKWPALEQAYGLTDPASGALTSGAVWSADDINLAISTGQAATLPQDAVGHGTLVTSCAAGNGAGGTSVYRGVAPGATLVVARIVDSNGSLLPINEVLGAIQFLFDRADDLHLPIVVNLSIGTDFGPHDGTMAWEQVLASHVGPASPGHALVAAAGNSGSIAPADSPVHENVYVSTHETTRVPIVTSGAQNGGVDVWVAMHPGAQVSVGLDGPEGTWIAPVKPSVSAGCAGQYAGVCNGSTPTSTADYEAAVVNGSEPKGSPVPAQSHGAVVIWTGRWPAGTYFVTLAGSGNVDLYLQGDGDATTPGGANFGFAHGAREGTVTLPATHPDIIAVGCTINKAGWRSINKSPFGLSVPLLDAVGGMPDPGQNVRNPIEGEPCWFTSAGPTLTGLEKPEIAAPGAAIVGALSSQAIPPVASSIFTGACPDGAQDQDCQQIDPLHAASAGTSFSAPIVSGAVAILFQRNRNMTQAEALGLLQAGAHHLRGPAPFDDQSGVGELDVLGALAVASQDPRSTAIVPDGTQSWLTLGAEYALADGSTPLQAIFELRGGPIGSGGGPPPAAAGFDDSRLSVYAHIEDSLIADPVSLARRAPGVWVATLRVPSGLGGSKLTIGATFDGVDLLHKTLPIATDHWNADYLPAVAGGCSAAALPSGDLGPSRLILWAAGTILLGAFRARTPLQRLRRRTSAEAYRIRKLVTAGRKLAQ